MSKYNTTYFEIYAALVLSKIGFLPIDFNIEWIQDKPDIQVGSIGVEVTSDAPKEHRSDLSIVNEIFGHDFSPEEKAEHLKKLDKRRMISDRFSEDMNSIEFKIYENSDILSEAIKGKDEKLYSYKKFYNNALFIFSSVFMLDTNNSKVTTALQNKTYSFNQIFIMCSSTLFKYENDILTKYNISEYLADFKITAMNYNQQYFNCHGKRK